MGDTVRVTVGGTDYSFECSEYFNYADPRNNFTSGDSEPAWKVTTNALTEDLKQDPDPSVPPPRGGIKWLCLGSADTAPVFEPLANQAVAQADLTATDVAGLRTDFNALLAKLRAAHILAS
jgi:hypothetical protein